MKTTLLTLAFIVGLLAMSWIVQGNEFFLYRYFAPRREAVRRDVFENTKSYRDGMIQELENMRFEYVKATPEQRTGLASLIIHRATTIDDSKLPDELREFIGDVRRDQLNPLAPATREGK